MLSIVFSLFLAFQALLLVNAELYVVDPRQDSTCRGGEPCTVTWLDDGRSPLLSSIGVVSVGLYTGQQQLVQALEPVDASAVRAFTFIPNPAAGPNSGAYYIGFRSANPPTNGTEVYYSYSPWFRLVGMTGSFETPLPSATVPIPIPSSLSASSSTAPLSTSTIGTISSAPPISTTTAISSVPSELSSVSTTESTALPSSSGFVTSRLTPTPSPATSSRSSSESEPETTSSSSDEPTPSEGAEDAEGAAACSTPVSNRVAIFITLVVVLAFFLL